MKKIYLLLLCMVLSSPVLFAQIFVTEAGAGAKDGTSWGNAYEGDKLQQAINEAELTTEKQVWVAKGIYKPTENLSTTGFLTDGITPVTDRDKTFVLKTGVEIYGGFAGTEVATIERVDIHTANQTILSGDFLGNDIANPLDPLDAIPSLDPLDPTYNAGYAAYVDSKTDNAYHVVSSRNASAGAVLDGFTIQHGIADGTGDITEGGEVIQQNWAGGICLRGDQIEATLRNLIIKDNISGAFSGGLHARGAGNINLVQVRFENNEGGGSGGAFYRYAGSSSTITNIDDCVFINNKGSGDGGGALIHTGISGAVLNITSSKFINNEHSRYAAAIWSGVGTANITATTFEGGTAVTRAGAIYSTGESTLNLDGCTFKNNTSATGGHCYIFNGTGNITNSIFENATATGNGGAIFVASGAVQVTISNSTFTSNIAEGTTGGAAVYTAAPLSISKSRFYSNRAVAGGAALYITGAFDHKVDNSLFYNNRSEATGNTGATIYLSTANSTLTATNNTFYANKSVSSHGAISFNNVTTVTLYSYNNIFNGNLGGYDFVNQTGGTSADVRNGTSANQIYSYNLFQNAISGSGNRTVVMPSYLDGTNPQPLFASTTEGDYNFLWPTEDSFAIDQGDDALYTSNVSDVATAKDLLGNDRLEGSSIDLGAIEWGVVLPVQVSSFTANLVNGRTQLKWEVGTEDNVDRYEVERSQNGTDFTTVATVGANGASSYSTTDNSPALGINYYRLVTIDNDGARKAYDRVQTVTVATLASEGVSVYPNPVKGIEVNVSLGNAAAGTYSYKVVGTTGSVMQQGSIDYDGTSAVVSVGSLPAGVYVLQFSNGAQAKLIKQ